MDIFIARYAVKKSMEDYALKKISEKHYERLYKKYYEEQAEVDRKLKSVKKK